MQKKGNLNARRYLISKIKHELAVEKLMTTLASRYAERHGGYIRILKAGFRYGDMAPMAYIEFVDRNIESKGKEFKALKNDYKNAKLIAEQSN